MPDLFVEDVGINNRPICTLYSTPTAPTVKEVISTGQGTMPTIWKVVKKSVPFRRMLQKSATWLEIIYCTRFRKRILILMTDLDYSVTASCAVEYV